MNMDRLSFILLFGASVHTLDLDGVSKLIRPSSKVFAGRVVLAPANEYNHFLRKATIFLIEHGPKGSWGVNLAKPSLLTIGEAAEGIVHGKLAENTLYMGGEYGGRGAFLLHAESDLEGATRIGDSDIFIGGINDAVRRVDHGINSRTDFKFFFNLAKWGPGELEKLADDGEWKSFHLHNDLILSQSADLDHVELWSLIRRTLEIDS
mmetsp:Transcript_14160/g.17623  ORF Transcript_14160/g.17623 Transcript_14160/m.17623 type:complete len:207 (-) Transcript_14160:1330-1950(-)